MFLAQHFCCMLIEWDFLMFPASPLKYWFFAGFLNYLQSMKEWTGWSFSLFCVRTSVLFDQWETYLKTKSVFLLLFLNPHFHKPWRKLKTQPLKLCWSLLNVPDTEDSTIKSPNTKILMALKLPYLVPINLDVNMVTMLCVHSLIMTAFNWMDPQGR